MCSEQYSSKANEEVTLSAASSGIKHGSKAISKAERWIRIINPGSDFHLLSFTGRPAYITLHSP
jgi:hypothetical protein